MSAVIVLAAGASRRMGTTDKLLLPIHDRPMYQHALTLAASLSVHTRIVVTNTDIIAQTAREMGFLVVPSPNAALGMGWSVAAGAKALYPSQMAVFLNADQPFLQVQTVQHLLDICTQTGKIVVPYTGDAPCSPCVFPARFLPELSALTGEKGGRAVWSQYPEQIQPVMLDNGDELADVDTPAGYAAAKARLTALE